MNIFSNIYKKLESWLMSENKEASFPLSDFERIKHEIKPCDVLLIEGHSKVAEVIKNITQSRWSHACLYIGRLHDIEDPVLRETIKQNFDGQPNTQLIIESQLGLGTVIRPLSTYDRKHIRICRPIDLVYSDSQKVLAYAINRLGTNYHIRQILDLARFYYPWSFLPKRFRSSLFQWQPGGCTKTVCSTMIAEAFGFIQYPILPLVKKQSEIEGKYQLFQRNPMLCTPSDFDYSPYFNIIKYPFMDFNGNNDSKYRLMPWHGDIELSEDEARMYMQASDQSNIEIGLSATPRNIQSIENQNHTHLKH
ncbi:hypothetical protein [Marinicellulosiphila megalodicopiae]|uniref:hypothetical protein n=1 Tax=Marinicellulosiphila megalodicopiae TaxID=2724896 RepID=UPI003BB1169B